VQSSINHNNAPALCPGWCATGPHVWETTEQGSEERWHEHTLFAARSADGAELIAVILTQADHRSAHTTEVRRGLPELTVQASGNHAMTPEQVEDAGRGLLEAAAGARAVAAVSR
jgi:hypothetical protein